MTTFRIVSQRTKKIHGSRVSRVIESLQNSEVAKVVSLSGIEDKVARFISNLPSSKTKLMSYLTSIEPKCYIDMVKFITLTNRVDTPSKDDSCFNMIIGLSSKYCKGVTISSMVDYLTQLDYFPY